MGIATRGVGGGEKVGHFGGGRRATESVWVWSKNGEIMKAE
jgi:hypothetical protein